jgi:hypothetical protein
MALPDLLCLVVTSTQAEGVRRLAQFHEGEVMVVAPGGDIGPPSSVGDPSGAHVPKVTGALVWSTTRAIRRYVRSTRRSVCFVVGQDVGLFERAVIAQARRSGAAIVLMPDGIVSSERFVGADLRSAVFDAIDRGLTLSKILTGRRASMGSSQPDLCLSWGSGWNQVWGRHLLDAISTGCPRTDELPDIPPPDARRLLICSQPVWLRQYGGRASANAWYSWIDVLCEPNVQDIRVRLHPIERDESASVTLSDWARARLSRSTAFVDDLAWAETVVAPPSTVLLEALAAGRNAACIASTPSVELLAASYPVFGEDAIPIIPSDAVRSFEDIPVLTKARREALLDRFLTNRGAAAAACAEGIRRHFT